MAVEHVNIVDPEIHEPKGVAAAPVSQIYISDGIGSGAWRYIPHSQCYYSDIGTGTTITAPTAYTVIDPTTVGDSLPKDFTHNLAGRLTYTGSTSIDCTVHASFSFKHSTGSGQDCYFQVHNNGSPITGTEFVASADSANYQTISLNVHLNVITGDYLEVYCKVASGNIIIHAMTLEVIGRL